MQTIISKYKQSCEQVAHAFAEYMWFENISPIKESYDTWDMWDDYTFYNVCDMVHILDKEYDPVACWFYYDYMVAVYSNAELRMNIDIFMRKFDLYNDTLDTFIERMKLEREENFKRINSPEFKREEAEKFKAMQKKFEEEYLNSL